MIRQTLATTVRATQDIWWRQVACGGTGSVQQLLLPNAALHMIDHHLHSSGIIPHVSESDDPTTHLYEHDWFCAGQSVACYPHDGLMRDALAQQETPQQQPASSSVPLFHTHVWVTRIGNSSLQLGSMITAKDNILALAQRAFVRKARGSKPSASFRENERDWFEKCRATETIQELLKSSELPPLMARLSSEMPSALDTSEPCLTVPIGPQHVNFGNHADHAFLASIAFQAFQTRLGTAVGQDPADLSVTYVSEAKLGQLVECYLVENQVYLMVKSGENEQERVLVLVAR